VFDPRTPRVDALDCEGRAADGEADDRDDREGAHVSSQDRPEQVEAGRDLRDRQKHPRPWCPEPCDERSREQQVDVPVVKLGRYRRKRAPGERPGSGHPDEQRHHEQCPDDVPHIEWQQLERLGQPDEGRGVVEGPEPVRDPIWILRIDGPVGKEVEARAWDRVEHGEHHDADRGEPESDR
jgi:hypothetical protein